MNVFLGYISEGWRGFLQGFDQKPKAIWSCSFSIYRSGLLELLFFGLSQRATGVVFCRELTKSRKLSGAALFRGIAAVRLGSLAVGMERQPEADGRKIFFRSTCR